MLLCLSISIPLLAQTDTDQVFTIVDDMPDFPGGDEALVSYLQETPYPSDAKNNGIEGKAFIKFIIERDGSVSDITLVRSSGNDLLDEAAVKRVENMPYWNAGTQKGAPVRVSLMVPVVFSINTFDTRPRKNN